MTGAVVVGIGAVPDERAVSWAAAEARDRGLGLRLVHALELPVDHHPGRARAAAPARTERARVALRDAVATARWVAPDLDVETAVVEGGPAAVLRAQARQAALVVVGCDGPGRLGDLLLGGVVRALVGHVDAPVAVVPRGYDPAEPVGDHTPVIVGDDGRPDCTGAWRFAADRAQRRGVPLVAVRVLADDHVDRKLVDRARGAEVLVLGVEHAWFHHARVASGVLRHASCPVIIVPPSPVGHVAAVPAARGGHG